MTVQWQTIPIPLTGGVSTKADEKALPPSKLIDLENGTFERPGAIKKANGARALGRGIVGSTSVIQVGQAIATLRDELVCADADHLYSYDESLNAWSDRGSFASAYVTQRPIARNTYGQTAQDSSVHSTGLLVAAWEDSQGGVRYSVVDTNTGVAVVPDGLVDASGSRPKVLALGNYILILWVNGTEVRYAPIAVSNPSVLGTTTAAASSVSSSLFDAEVIGQRLFLIWATSTGWSVKYYTVSLAASAPVAVSVTTPTIVTLFEDSLENRVVLCWRSGGTTSYQVRSYGLDEVITATSTVGSTANLIALTGVAIPGATSKLRFFGSFSGSTADLDVVRQGAIDNYGASTITVVSRSVSLAGKARLYNGTPIVPVAHASTLQSTYFLLDNVGNVLGKVLYGLGGGRYTRTTLPQFNALSSTQFQVALLAKGMLTTEGGKVATLTGVTSVTFDLYDRSNSYSRAEVGGALHLGGGYLSMYDGDAVVEHGFHLWPEGGTVANLDSDTGSSSVYGYRLVYEWVDAQGQIHRSTPSPAVSHSKLTPIDGTHRTTVTFPCLRVTAKRSGRRQVQCVVYRTTANGNVFYRSSPPAAPTYNDPTSDTVSYADSVMDATLLGNPQLYTTGEIENVSPPPVSSLTVHQNRLVALDSTNPLQLWWSKPVIPGSPVEFSDAFIQNVDPVGGDVITTARMDQWLVVFKAGTIFATAEEGPPASGAGYAFTSCQQVPSKVGCADPRSVNLGDDGLTFRSAKGWHTLTRAMQVVDLPDVYRWRDAVVAGAHTMPGTHETRWAMFDGYSLVHDDMVDQWGIRTRTQAVDSVIWRGVQAYIRPDGQARVETPGMFSDAGAWMPKKIRTAWIQFAGLSGFQRLKHLTILGDYVSPHRLRVSVAYDFDSTPSQVFEVDAGALLSSNVYGSDSVYGGAVLPADSLVYGGEFPAYAFRLNLARQKCTAIQVTIEDLAPSSGDVGEGCSVTSITATAGMKVGTRKLPASRQA